MQKTLNKKEPLVCKYNVQTNLPIMAKVRQLIIEPMRYVREEP